MRKNQRRCNVTNLKVFSPSQTETYTQCSIKRQLQYVEHLRPKIMGKPGVAAMMGTAMAAGIETYYRKQFQLLPEVTAVATWWDEIEHFRKAGGTIEDAKLDRMPALLARAQQYYAEHDPVKENKWHLIGAEYPFPEFGYGRCDLIVDDGEGYAAVDHKWKESLYVKAGETKDQARNRTLMDYKDSWKMLQYVWSIRQHFQKPSTHYYIVLGELTPKPHLTIQRFDVSEDVMKQFGVSALQHWSDMNALDRGERTLAMAAIHETKYGPCEFKDACLEMGLDRERMKFKYLTLNRRAKA